MNGVKIEGNKATVGITYHSQEHLGDVVYVELPDVGRSVSQGVISVVEVEKEGQLEVRGEFNSFEMIKEIVKIDQSVHIIKIEQEVKLQPQDDEGKHPFNLEEVNYPFSQFEKVNKQSDGDDAGSSSWTTSLQPYEWWEKAKVIGVSMAEQAKVIGVGVAEQAKVTGVGVAKQGGGIVQGVIGFFERRKRAEKVRLHFQRLKEQDMKEKKIWMEKMSKKQGATQN
ncbi:unnamed protein product [Microthlaspi erraticum]|uniref:Uncharacterized protein n=1 Tax=Microthlaspi erraticum TaxID=1685480 RepID=A0A6D2JEK3_9BRAS|nr:unnamed protein product [Microthlaspi erraticum]